MEQRRRTHEHRKQALRAVPATNMPQLSPYTRGRTPDQGDAHCRTLRGGRAVPRSLSLRARQSRRMARAGAQHAQQRDVTQTRKAVRQDPTYPSVLYARRRYRSPLTIANVHRRTWFLERVLKLGLVQIAKEYECVRPLSCYFVSSRFFPGLLVEKAISEREHGP
jgi:hypothetical protein